MQTKTLAARLPDGRLVSRRTPKPFRQVVVLECTPRGQAPTYQVLGWWVRTDLAFAQVGRTLEQWPLHVQAQHGFEQVRVLSLPCYSM